MGRLLLVDDGTLDTVLVCSVCGLEIRYSGESFPREYDGSLSVDSIEEATEEHDTECSGVLECE